MWTVVVTAAAAWIAAAGAAPDAAGGYRLSVRPTRELFTKPLGSSIVLTCELQSASSHDETAVASLQWLDGRRAPVNESPGRVYVEQDGPAVRKLYITAIQSQDAGTYTCSGAAAGRRTLEKSVTMMLFKDITFDHAPSPQHPRIFDDWLVECIVSGQPPPGVSWRYKGRRVTTRGRYEVRPRGLLIRNATEADNGDYTCRAEVESEGRYDERKISVVVHIPPAMASDTPRRVEGVVGSATALSCRATGLPAPKYEFHKVGGAKVITSPSVEVDTYGGRLTFRSVRKTDEGEYACKAINDVGSEAAFVRLSVLVPAEVYEFANVTQTEGTTAALVCLAHGDPAPTMRLQRVVGYDLVDVPLRGATPGRAELVIGSLKPEDAAPFVCSASNSAGRSEARAAVVVNYRPRFSVDRHGALAYAWVGKTANLTCRVRAHPAPTVEWIHNNMLLTDNNTYRIYATGGHHALEIRVRDGDESWVYGRYSCRASNAVGSNTHALQLIEATVPAPPSAVNVTDRTPNTVTLRILPPAAITGLDVAGYRVKYEEFVYDFGADEEVTLENLQPSTRYLFRVAAKNEVGVGTAVEQSVITANVREPYPIQINSAPLSNKANEYLVSWRTPQTGGKPITGYSIRYQRVRVKAGTFDVEAAVGDWVTRSTVDSPRRPVLEYRLRGLSASTYYRVDVRASNQMGTSAAGEPFVFLTAEGSDEPGLAPVRAGVSMTTVVAVAVAVLVALLIVVDVSCYFVNGCGLTMCVCVHVCGQEAAAASSGAARKANEKEIEEGESKEMLKPPSESAKAVQEQVVWDSEELPVPPPPESTENQLSYEEEQRQKNRRSILSQGDERWKDVVQELEKELSVKKARENDETEASAN